MNGTSSSHFKSNPLPSENKVLNDLDYEQLGKQPKLISAASPWIPKINVQNLSELQKIIFDTLRGNTPPINRVFRKDYLRSVIWKKNPQFLKEARDLIKEILEDIFPQSNQKLSSSDTFHIEMIIGDMLSLYPFLSPEHNELISIPIRVNDQWHLIDYNIELLPLTPQRMGSPLVAFGLIPKLPDVYPPLLLFKGTTYPTDEGFFLSILTDINPFLPVGNLGFRAGKRPITQWLNDHTKKFKVNIYGKSLGGALAWQVALDNPDKVDTVMTYGSPGFTPKYLKRCEELEKKQSLPTIHMFFQENDPVPQLDQKAKSGIHYYQVIGKNHAKGISAHAQMFSAHENSTILHFDPKQDIQKKIHNFGTLLKIFASLTIFPILLVIFAIKLITLYISKIIKQQMTILKSTSFFNLYFSVKMAEEPEAKKEVI